MENWRTQTIFIITYRNKNHHKNSNFINSEKTGASDN